jgi:threonyl-tRNA synthetase
VITPQILDVDVWHTSGHYANYRDAMFFAAPHEEEAEEGESPEERQFAVKPMNCPTHCLIYATRMRSYRDLPIRYADFGRLHRYERSGVTSGLMRVRTFSQDDAHVFCTQEQVEQEVISVVEMILEIYDTFGFEEVDIEISTRPEKALGTPETWERAENALKAALDRRNIAYGIDAGGGAFYGPKIDFKVKDALGREWQLGTVQLDYQLPERFELTYVGADGDEHRPVMIHRAMLGSLERFLGVLIEHVAGAFPLWLSPVQAVVLPVSEKFADYGARVRDELIERGLRVELDDRGEKLGYKIREAQLQKIPYMLVVGGREQERVKRGAIRKNRRKKILKQAKGYYGLKSRHRIAKQAVDRALSFAYRDRRQRKRQMRSLWIVRINAAAREQRPLLQPDDRRSQGGRATSSTARCSPTWRCATPPPSPAWRRPPGEALDQPAAE